jgi:NADH-quinone oxidoreductase subunit J
MELTAFIILTILAISGAIVTVTHRNPVYCALSLIICFLAIAGFYILLSAPFLAAIQIIIYAGSIMTLFIFTIMLMDLDRSHLDKEPTTMNKIIACLLGFVLFFQIILVTSSGVLTGKVGEWTPEKIKAIGHTQIIGKVLFSEFLYPFEIISLILLVALVGAIVIGKKKP